MGVGVIEISIIGGHRVGCEVGACVGPADVGILDACVGAADVGIIVGEDRVSCEVGAGVGAAGVRAIVGTGEGAGDGEIVLTNTESTDAEDIERRRWSASLPARRRWPS